MREREGERESITIIRDNSQKDTQTLANQLLKTEKGGVDIPQAFVCDHLKQLLFPF